MRLLHIDSSILGEKSASRALSREIVLRWQTAVPDLETVEVDLAAEPLPHLGAGVSEAARDARALEEFLAADVVVIGAPMYNFTVPSQLKAWIDRILVAGRTFRYTQDGPVGLSGASASSWPSRRAGCFIPGTRESMSRLICVTCSVSSGSRT